MKRLLTILIILLYAGDHIAQTYNYIGVENGLSNRRVFAIQKDSTGYMWFLTHDGIDRFDGKEFTVYKLFDGEEEVNSMMNMNWLYTDSEGTLWEIGKQGRVFRYDAWQERFKLVYKLPANEADDEVNPVSYAFVDSRCTVWLCSRQHICLYDSHTGKVRVLRNGLNERITQVEQTSPDHFFVGTESGIHYAYLTQEALELSPCGKLDSLHLQVNELYHHLPSNKVFIGTFQRGMYVYELSTHQLKEIRSNLMDVRINRICAFGADEILIATEGAGVYKMQTENYEAVPYIVADYSRPNAMNGNTISDIYVDEEQRIWMANYPIGVTVRNNRYTEYRWLKHAIGNRQSLVNDQVNAVIEDADGDLWMATNNGISLYESRTQRWHSFLSSFDSPGHSQNHIFISLCEVSPGIIWAGGYSSGIYEIDKRQLTVDYFTPSLFDALNMRPDKYIRSIVKDSEGNVWSGGYYNLKRIDYRHKDISYFPGLSGITTILEKDASSMWIGTATGLFLLEKQSGKYRHIHLPISSCYIYSLFQSADGLLYIGTSNSGLVIYDPRKETLEHFHKENSALLSDNIYTILYDGSQRLLLCTEQGLSTFRLHERTFRNWTKEQGLKSEHFNADAGVLRRNGDFVLGSTDGVIVFNKELVLPQQHRSRMILSDLQLFYQTVYPGGKDSPLTRDIDHTEVLHLRHDQNLLSLHVSSINYDYPSLILYSWKLEGYYAEWSRPGRESTIRFTNLNPGKYTLRIRAISNEEKQRVLEERSLEIVVHRPFWQTPTAYALYLLLTAALLTGILRLIMLRRQRAVSNEKIRFFIHTAHDIRTPLTLIKAPLEVLAEEGRLSEEGQHNVHTALHNVEALLRLTTNLINFERADTYASPLCTTEHELGGYLHETVEAFQTLARNKHIRLTYESEFGYLSVWMDKDKMDTILKNLLSNALKYTPEGGSVCLKAEADGDEWSVEVKDNGIGIPANEQKKLFRMHYRGSNAINSKVTGSGIGLMLVQKLVHLHKGKLTFSSAEGKGTTVRITFPLSALVYHKAILRGKSGLHGNTFAGNDELTHPTPHTETQPTSEDAVEAEGGKERLRIVIAEDNDELRRYLHDLLTPTYDVTLCTNGLEALRVVKELSPDLLISDIMMPELRGDELCTRLKSDIETSHIPIVLLTALNSEQNIIQGLQRGADEYIVKPFSVGVLRATITTILNNRALLRRKYSNPDWIEETPVAPETAACETDPEWQFIADIKRHVEEHIDRPDFTVDTLCSLMNMSRTSFYNKLKALTGKAPADYIRLIRLHRAAQLLQEGRYSIGEVADKTGFNDAKYFRELFKKQFGVSPSKYKPQS